MPYYMVLFKHRPQRLTDAVQAQHENFVGELISRRTVLLGGGFGSPVGDFFGAYVLNMSSQQEAERTARADPYVTSDAAGAVVTSAIVEALGDSPIIRLTPPILLLLQRGAFRVSLGRWKSNRQRLNG